MSVAGGGEDEKPALELLGIEWVQPRVCEDSYANRRELREAGYKWRSVPPEPGSMMPTGLIEVPDPKVELASQTARRADFLVRPGDPWSDYLDVREIPLDAVGVPYFVLRRLQKWKAWESRPGKVAITAGVGDRGPTASMLPAATKEHAGKEPYLPVRCTAVKADGNRCWGWCTEDNEGYPPLCDKHLPGAVLAANQQGWNITLARVKAVQAAPAMVDVLEELAEGAASEQVRLKASTEILDRAGVTASTDLNINVTESGPSPSVEVRSRLAALEARLRPPSAASSDEEPVDAEIVDETEAAGG